MTLACEKKRKWKSLSCVQLFAIHGLNSPGQNTRVGSLSLLQGIFPTQGSNPGLPHCRWILYHLGHKGSPRLLEWVAYPFSNGSSQPRNWNGVSCIAGGFFTNWTIKEAQIRCNIHKMGEGGFGVVYKGYVNNRTVAVKKLAAVSYIFWKRKNYTVS